MAKKYYNCPIELTLDTIGGKWKGVILWHLQEQGALRTSELRRAIPRISEKMLIQQLRSLEAAGVIQRQVFHTVPPHVEYSLTAHGRNLEGALKALCDWGKQHEQHLGNP